MPDGVVYENMPSSKVFYLDDYREVWAPAKLECASCTSVHVGIMDIRLSTFDLVCPNCERPTLSAVEVLSASTLSSALNVVANLR